MTQIAYNYTVDPSVLRALNPRRMNRAVSVGVRKASVRIAKDLRRQSKLAAPVRTGRLRRGIKIRRRRVRPQQYRLEVYATDSASRGGQRIEYFYIVEARTMFVARVVRSRITRYQRILNVEVGRAIREALQP